MLLKNFQRVKLLGGFKVEWKLVQEHQDKEVFQLTPEKNMSKKINQIIKQRNLRPFCPSVIKENVKEYFKRSYDSKFMTISFEAKNN